MMGLEVIIALNKEAGERAQGKGILPLLIPAKFHTFSLKSQFAIMKTIPNLGDYTPEGWSSTERENGRGISPHLGHCGLVLVDKMNFGEDEGGLALGAREFMRDWIKPGYAYAIVEESQFQVVVGEFEEGES